jgi:hypothetical protein
MDGLRAPARRPKQIKQPMLVKEKKIPMQTNNNYFMIMATVLVTAGIVGGGIYYWQHRFVKNQINSIETSARNTRKEFETRIENLLDQIKGIENEKTELKKTADSLKEDFSKTEEILKFAKKDYVNGDLGFSFSYPAILGDVSYIVNEQAKSFSGNFDKNEKLFFGGISQNGLSGGKISKILFSSGFFKIGDKYYLFAGEKKANNYLLNPFKILKNDAGDEILLIDKKSFSDNDNSRILAEDIGGNIAALINLDNKNNSGLAFVNSDFGLMQMDKFEEMLKTVKITKF